jgi:hypothetical protein
MVKRQLQRLSTAGSRVLTTYRASVLLFQQQTLAHAVSVLWITPEFPLYFK